MSVSQIVMALCVIAYAAISYTLVLLSFRDLRLRPRVRGGNRTIWGLVILCIPVFGALFYSVMGPTSFRQSSGTRIAPVAEADPVMRYATELPDQRPANVTPLRPRPAATISGRNPARRPGLTRSRAHNTTVGTSRTRRPGA